MEQLQHRVAPARRERPSGGSRIESIVIPRRSDDPLVDRRSTIPWPGHFPRLIPQFEFARAYAHEITLFLPVHIPAIKRKWALDRPIPSRDPSLVSSCGISRPLVASLFLSLCFSRYSSLAYYSLSSQASPIISRAVHRVAHNSVDKNNQV